MFRLHACAWYDACMKASAHERPVVNVAIRLDPRKHRRLRQRALQEGKSLQGVLEELIDSWIGAGSGADNPVADLRGSLSGSNVLELRRAERAAELERDRSRL